MSPRTGLIVISDPVPVARKVDLLLAGADDYLVGPFCGEELEARIMTLALPVPSRRTERAGARRFEDQSRAAERELLRAVRLTRKEYELLLFFVRNPRKVLTHEMIAEYLWGDFKSLSADCFDFIYSHVKNIRKKLSGAGAGGIIDTIYGVGYVIK